MTAYIDSTTEPRSRSSAAASVIDGTKVYGNGATKVRALDGVTLDFAAGQFSAIMGPSGSGKSTLVHCVAGLDTLTSGEVRVGGIDLTRLDDKRLTLLRRDRIGFVFQAYNLVPTLSALENITLPATLSSAQSGWVAAWPIGRASCPAGSSSGSRLPVLSPPGRRSSSPMSRPAISTRGPARTSSRSCARRHGNLARPSSWSPTTRWRPATPAGWCS
jgi:ABC-type sugar transport system ATPase subunit